jgi:hypothetical protein
VLFARNTAAPFFGDRAITGLDSAAFADTVRPGAKVFQADPVKPSHHFFLQFEPEWTHDLVPENDARRIGEGVLPSFKRSHRPHNVADADPTAVAGQAITAAGDSRHHVRHAEQLAQPAQPFCSCGKMHRAMDQQISDRRICAAYLRTDPKSFICVSSVWISPVFCSTRFTMSFNVRARSLRY